jgi:hypothetical protein
MCISLAQGNTSRRAFLRRGTATLAAVAAAPLLLQTSVDAQASPDGTPSPDGSGTPAAAPPDERAQRYKSHGSGTLLSASSGMASLLSSTRAS